MTRVRIFRLGRWWWWRCERPYCGVGHHHDWNHAYAVGRQHAIFHKESAR